MADVTDSTLCLQCGESRGAVRAEKLYCAILTGGETVEVDEDFPHHRWADWRDTELERFWIRPEAYDRHRRTPLRHMQWVACDDTIRGHNYATETDTDLGIREGQCWACGQQTHLGTLFIGDNAYPIRLGPIIPNPPSTLTYLFPALAASTTPEGA